MSAVEDQVEALQTMGLDDLRTVWRANIGPPPKLRSKQLLRLCLAWKIQSDAYGGLDADTRRRLRRGGQGAQAADRLAVGMKLIQQWRGQAHEVTVVEGGFAYQGQTWRSLSEIARHIAGSRWNGPRFFGLRTEDGRSNVG